MSMALPEIERLAHLDSVVIRVAGLESAGEVRIGSWSIESGDFWLIGGKAGAGKSVVLAGVAGLLPVDEGRITLQSAAGGAPLAGLVYDRGGRLFRDMTVYENIALAPGYHGLGEPDEVEKKVEKVIVDLGLEPIADRYPPEIHRSWHGKVALGRALVTGPKILLLDDPLAGLDPGTRRWWVESLRKLVNGQWAWADRRTAVVVGCEDAGAWRGMANRLAWIDRGVFTEIRASQKVAGSWGTEAQEWLESAGMKQKD